MIMEPILEIRGLNSFYRQGHGAFSRGKTVQVLRDINVTIGQGEVLGLVGESGSGKSTLAKSILGMTEYQGQIIHHSQRPQMVFQDPYSSLNPAFSIRRIVEEPLRIYGKYSPAERARRVEEMLQALQSRGYHLGVISNNASLYNVFNVLEDYGIRKYMEDVTVSSVTGYRKPHQELFRISMHQMQVVPAECVYVGDTVSRDIIGSKRAGFAKAVQIGSYLSAEKDADVAADAEKPDLVISDIRDIVPWLDEINPELAPK